MNKRTKCRCNRKLALTQRAIDELSHIRGIRIEVTLKAQCEDCKGFVFETTKIVPKVVKLEL